MGFHNAVRDGEAEIGAGRTAEKIRSLLVLLVGAAALFGLAFGTMLLLTSPDGWVMKAANQAMITAQQGTLASYDVADTR